MQPTLARLRDEFVAHLPERIVALQALLDALAHNEYASLQALHEAAHSLAGAACTHRLRLVSHAAREMQDIAAALPMPVNDADLQALREALARLTAHAANPAPTLMLPRQRLNGVRIMVVVDDAQHAAWLCSVLEDAGYQVEVFCDLAAFRAALQQQLPAAVIMDMVLESGDAGARIIAEMKAQSLRAVPVIFMSEGRGVAARLAAHRAGATRYLVKPVEPEVLLRTVADSAALKPLQPYRVMVVDDSRLELVVHSSMLRQAGMEVREVGNPLHVPDMLEDFAAEVLLLDMHMPQCSGPELAVLLSDDERYANIPIIYLSIETDFAQQLLALDGGGDHFLVKPANPAHLVSVIGMHARRYRQAREQTESLRAVNYEQDRQRQAQDAHAIVSVADAAGNIIHANDKFCEISGYSRAELLGKNHRVVRSGVHPPEFYAGMWSTISGGKIWHGEVCNRSKDGHLYWVETTIVPFLDENGLPYQYVSMRTDISRIKQSEEALRNSREELRLAFERLNKITSQVPGVIYQFRLHLDGSVCFPYASEGIHEVFRLSPEDVREDASMAFALVHADDLDALHASIQNSARDLMPWCHEFRIKHSDGTQRWLLGESTPQRDPDGSILWHGFINDVTARKQIEVALMESRARVEEAQTRAHLGNWEADMVSGNLHWSEEIYRIFGLDSAHHAPSVEAFMAAVHPDDVQMVRAIQRSAAETGIQDVVHRIIRPNGEVRHVHELAQSQVDEEGRLIRLSGTVQDVTDLKLTELALIQAREAAESGSRAKSEFLASMSHELRTPLNAILGFSQLFTMDARLPQEVRSNAQEIERAGQHLLSLINDMIDLARIEAGKLGLALEPVQVNRILEETQSMMQSLARDKSVRLSESDCGGQDVTVQADHSRLRQVVINLVSNAIKYNKPQGNVSISCHAHGDRVRISVTDTGRGIAADKQARIFNAFDRLGEERGEVEGTGIGLVITKRIVEAMGGCIGFASVEGQGSTFWVEFPLLVEAPHAALQQAARAPVPAEAEAVSPQLKRHAVLYIEDNFMNMRLMQQIFASRKHLELHHAESAEAGIALAQIHPPALILMDINLPGMDGYAALQALKADARTCAIPVIAVTANAMLGDKAHGLQAGFVDYLTKPLDIASLMSMLNEMFKA